MIVAILLIICGAQLLVLLLALAWLVNKKITATAKMPAEKPALVSIFIAARNEERNILECLEAIYKLNYPKENYEVLIGNDQSEDNTRNIIENFILDKHNFRLVDITGTLGKALGKANVLAQLAQHAKGSYFFITDADIRVPVEWINTLLPHLIESKYVVSGVSIVRSGTLWGQLQEWEWLFLYTMNSFMQDITPITCSGNNMAVSAKAYWATGGYENIEFSVTEDYRLYRELEKHGYTHKQLFEKDATAWAAPVFNFRDLLGQRKRWMTGGKGLPFIFWLLMAIYSLFLPAFLILLFLFPVASVFILLLKLLLDFILLFFSSRHLGFRLRLYNFLFFEIYEHAMNVTSFFYYLWPGKVVWKGRKY